MVNELIAEGYRITKYELSALSPYITKHINRFGDYQLNFEQYMPPIQYEIIKMTGFYMNRCHTPS